MRPVVVVVVPTFSRLRCLRSSSSSAAVLPLSRRSACSTPASASCRQPSTVEPCTPRRRAIWSTVALLPNSSSTACCRSSTVRRPGRARTSGSPNRQVWCRFNRGCFTRLRGGRAFPGASHCRCFVTRSQGTSSFCMCQPLDGEHHDRYRDLYITKMHPSDLLQDARLPGLIGGAGLRCRVLHGDVVPGQIKLGWGAREDEGGSAGRSRWCRMRSLTSRCVMTLRMRNELPHRGH